jgi:D-alanyl-D-alanine carboxypeptidase (penicillin-binding protein 5/6)
MRRAPRFLAAAVVASVAAAGQLAAWPASAAALPGPVAARPASPAAQPQASSQSPGLPAAGSGPAGVLAASAELVNADTGRWLWGRSTQIEHPIASITKVMTALVVINAGNLNRKIRVTDAARQYGKSFDPGSAGLHPGDVLTARQLLAAMLLPSASDAAYLLASSYGPGWPAFVRTMNATAGKLGMTRTHFANFDGLPWPTEYSTYSTARDLIRLAGAAMKLPAFRQIVAQRSQWIAATRQHWRYLWKNTNLLIRSYRGATGIKTGFTRAAGYCLLFAARYGGQDLIGVVLDSTSTDPSVRFTAAGSLLSWGFGISG